MVGKKVTFLYLALVLFCLLMQGREVCCSDSGYPSRPVTIIVPFAAGGGLDLATRLLAKYAEPELGQNIQVVNDTAGGNIQGNMRGIAAEPDGYTLGAWGPGLVTDEFLVKNATYSYRDVQPVCMFADDPEVVAIGKHFADEHAIRTLAELVDYVRKHPGLVTIGMGGNWTPHDFLRIQLETAADVKFNRMPFLGGRPALQATAEGNCNVALPFVSELLGLSDADKIVPLAVAYGERVSQQPDIPTMGEEGYPDVMQTIWRVLTVPQGTPSALVARLEDAFGKAMANPEFRKEAERIGTNPVFKNADLTARFLEAEHERYSRLIAQFGIGK